MQHSATVHAKALDLCVAIHRMTTEASSGHPTSATSLAHVVTELMFQHMRWDPADPGRPGSDRLVLSEGHACPVVYAACADLGMAMPDGHRMTVDEMMQLRSIDSEVDGHPNPEAGFPFFDTATGSLGQGLSHAAGLALAARLDEFDSRIFCIIGDGEAREGQVAEALDFLLDEDLRAVCPIFNCNGLGQSDMVSDRQSADAIVRRLEAMGFSVQDIDGHVPDQIEKALDAHSRAHADEGPPVAIVARTVKGWGTPSMQGEGHHGKPAGDDRLDQMTRELAATRERLGAKAYEVLRPASVPDAVRPPASYAEAPSFREALDEFELGDWLDNDALATRKAFGVALRALGRSRSDVVALDADVKNSTYSQLFAADSRARSRFFECRIAEQNMLSTAAGLASADRIPFVSSFGKFITRAYDQIELALLGGANLKIVGSHCGISLAADGPSQMALPDVAWFRSLSTARRSDGRPLVYVLTPSDAFSTYALTIAMAEDDGASYLRTLRPDVDLLYDEMDSFELGGHKVLREGRDVLVLATGFMVHVAKKAVEQLAEEGVDATLVDLYSLPFDDSAIVQLARENERRVLTVEDNFGNAAGSAVADACAHAEATVRVEQMYVDRFPKSGRTPEDLLEYCGLSGKAIQDRVRRIVARTGGVAARA